MHFIKPVIIPCVQLFFFLLDLLNSVDINVIGTHSVSDVEVLSTFLKILTILKPSDGNELPTVLHLWENNNLPLYKNV